MLAHATAALALAAFAYSAVRALEAPAAKWWWLAAGCALGGDGLTRPLSAAAFSLPWLVLLALTGRPHPRAGAGAAPLPPSRAPPAAAFSLPWLVLLALTVRRDRRAVPGAALFLLAGAVAAALFAGYNAAVTGSPFRTGYQVFAENYRFTFTLGSLPAAAPVAALYELYYSLARLNFWLLGWPVSLALIPFAGRA